MMNKLNNILIGLLWLLAVTLGTTFWFNTMYGFNIFSIQHWQHLAYMQAIGQAVKPSFYISLVIAVIIALFGLYKLLQPRIRQVTLPIFDYSSHSESHNSSIRKNDESDVNNQQQESIAVESRHIVTTHDPVRPPRLNITNISRTAMESHVPLISEQTPKNVSENERTEIRNIFESAGYVYKGAPKIKNVHTAVVAIGTDEVLWIGAIRAKNTDMQSAVQTLSNVFSDTLDDIEIHINAFIISAPDVADATPDILQFASIDDLRDYIARNPNTKLDDDETENFDAYSGYIGTVIDYIGKI